MRTDQLKFFFFWLPSHAKISPPSSARTMIPMATFMIAALLAREVLATGAGVAIAVMFCRATADTGRLVIVVVAC